MKFRTSKRPATSLILLLVFGVALAVAFVYAPDAILGLSHPELIGDSALAAAIGSALVSLWGSTSAIYPPDVSAMIDYWFQYHAIKVGICLLALIVATLLTAHLWSRFLMTTRRAAAAGRAVGAACCGVAAAAVLVVLGLNIQASIVPLPALLQYPLEPSHALIEVAVGISNAAQDPTSAAAAAPAFTILMAEVERYEWTMVVLCSVLALLPLSGIVVLCRQFLRDRRGRSSVRAMWCTLGVTALLVLMLAMLQALHSVNAALDPTATLLGLL